MVKSLAQHRTTMGVIASGGIDMAGKGGAEEAEAFGFGHAECMRHFQRHAGNDRRSEAGQSVWDVGDRPQLGM